MKSIQIQVHKAGASRLVIGFSALSLLGAFSYWLVPSSPAVDARQLWVEPVQSGDLTLTLNGSGELVPADLLTLASVPGGTVTRVHVKPGVVLKAGEPIVSLSNPELVQRLSAARKARAEQEATRAGLESDLMVQRLELETRLDELRGRLAADGAELAAYEKLLAKSVVSRIQYDKLRIGFEALQAQVRQAEQRVAQFRMAQEARLKAADLAEARLSEEAASLARQVDELVLRAAESGVLHQLGEGMVEGAPLQAGTVVAKLARSERLRAEIRIPAARLSELKTGQQVSLDLRSAKLEGRVERIDPRVEQDQVLVEVSLPEALPGEARAGLPVSAEIETARLAGVLYVQRPVGAEAGAVRPVFKLEPDGDALLRQEVRFGRLGGRHIVIESGLKPGERVVLSDMSAYADEMRLDLNGV